MNTYTEMLDKDGQMQYAYDLFNENNNTYGGTDVSANYQRMLGKKKNCLQYLIVIAIVRLVVILINTFLI